VWGGVVGGARVGHLVGDRRVGASSMVLKEPVRDYGSQSLDHDVQDCC
jgi:hypothetical protein